MFELDIWRLRPPTTDIAISRRVVTDGSLLAWRGKCDLAMRSGFKVLRSISFARKQQVGGCEGHFEVSEGVRLPERDFILWKESIVSGRWFGGQGFLFSFW